MTFRVISKHSCYVSERERVALGSRCLTRIHFTAKQCRFTSHRRKILKQWLTSKLQNSMPVRPLLDIHVISMFAPVIGQTWPEMTQHSRSTPTWTRRHTEKRAALSSDRCGESESVWRLAKDGLTLHSGPKTIRY